MGKTSIEWCTDVWNPTRGCSRVSPGCGGPNRQGGCYAEVMAARFSDPGQWGHGYATMKKGDPRWTGKYCSIPTEARATVQANVAFAGRGSKDRQTCEVAYRRIAWETEGRTAIGKPNPARWKETNWSKWRARIKANPTPFGAPAQKKPDASVTKLADKRK